MWVANMRPATSFHPEQSAAVYSELSRAQLLEGFWSV